MSLQDAKMIQAIESFRDSAPHVCELCGISTMSFGVWFPEGEKTRLILKIPEGKQRMLIYAICEQCQDKKNFNEEVEKKMFRTFCMESFLVPAIDADGNYYIEHEGVKIYGEYVLPSKDHPGFFVPNIN